MRPGQYFISTHAFTEGDGIACINANRLKYFNSRLHGRRQFFSHIRHSASLFQLTPSRKATRSRATTMSKSEISTHAFTEGDSWEKSQKKRTAHFNSRLHGRRLSSNRLSSRERYFNSRLHGRRRVAKIPGNSVITHFNSRLHGRRLYPSDDLAKDTSISTHAFTEGDGVVAGVEGDKNVFQLTPSRKATANSNNFCC